jgi:hypothetical protein
LSAFFAVGDKAVEGDTGAEGSFTGFTRNFDISLPVETSSVGAFISVKRRYDMVYLPVL